jgi:tRNA (cmo5U34)-methyltransferase
MGHSVEKHLVVSPAVYDAEIRRFVPGYDAMLDEVIGALEEHLSPGEARVLDLGAGTGALSERIASRFEGVRLVLLDADADMLARAKLRLERESHRIELRKGSFSDPLPSCDIAVASLSLHHVRTRDEKVNTYRRIFDALKPNGVLVNADAAVPASPALSDPLMKRWAKHLVDRGDSEAEAYDRFRQWAEEDRYFGLEEELDMVRSAGFAMVDVRWRSGPISVLVARR